MTIYDYIAAATLGAGTFTIAVSLSSWPKRADFGLDGQGEIDFRDTVQDTARGCYLSLAGIMGGGLWLML